MMLSTCWILIYILGFSLCSDAASFMQLPIGWTFPALSKSTEQTGTSTYSVINSIQRFDISHSYNFGFLQNNTSDDNRLFVLSIWISLENSDIVAVPVWTANMDKPVDEAGLLTVGGGGTLMLKDGDGTVVWNVTDVAFMELDVSGNLVLYNASNVTVWQSFMHPTDTLLQEQRLEVGMKLVSNSGLFSAVMETVGFIFYIHLPQPYPYWFVTSNGFFGSTDPDSNIIPKIKRACPNSSSYFLAGAFFTMGEACEINVFAFATNNPSSSLYWKLDDDGYLRGFSVDRVSQNISMELPGESALHISNVSKPFNIEEEKKNEWSRCLSPSACGSYGICSSRNASCVCPPSSAPIFGPFSSTLGCPLRIPLGCNATASKHYLLEIKNTTFAPMLVKNSSITVLPLEKCKVRCMLDCSCVAVFYQHNNSLCFSISLQLSLLHIDDSNFTAYIKVENASYTDYFLETSNDSDHHHSVNSHVVLLVVAISMVFFGSISVLVMYYFRKGIRKHSSDVADEKFLTALPCLAHRFSFKELVVATNGFNMKLGSGAFGSVYEGILEDGRKVAVKRLENATQIHKQFLAEVAILGGIKHNNVIRLYGFCSENSNRLLVYEYMENGSLDQWLFDKAEGKCLDWSTRFTVAIATAQGLAYLHEECPEPILHLDVKPQNILLGAELVAKVSDFGLSRLVDAGKSRVVTGVRGTPGYMAPELLWNSAMTKMCDVYSYGMVLLEIVGGRRNVRTFDEASRSWYDFPAWAVKKVEEGNVVEFVDQSLGDSFDAEEVKRVVQVALCCIQRDPKRRPTMAAIVKMLEGKLQIPTPPPSSSNLVLLQLQALLKSLHRSFYSYVGGGDTD